MQPEAPRLRENLRQIRDGTRGLWRVVTYPIRSTSATGSWLRLALMVGGMVLAYLWLQDLIGELPDVFKALKDFFENLAELFRLLFQLIIPATKPGEPPSVPSIPRLVKLQLFLRQFKQDDFQDFLVFFVIPLIWALGRALHIFEDTYRLNSFRAVLENLLAEYLPLFRRNVEIREADLVMDVTTIRPRRVGGPMRLEVDADSLAVLEPVWGNPRLITNTNRRVEVDAFERLRCIVDLRPFPLALNSRLTTRDGMRVELKQARFTVQVKRGQNGVDTTAVSRLVYGHWLGKAWENLVTRQRDTRRLLRRELAQFISDRKDLSALVVNPAVAGAYPVAEQLKQEFVRYFNGRPEHGLQIEWQGAENGAWETGEDLSGPGLLAARQASQEIHARRLELPQMEPEQLTKAEIQNMAGQVLDRADALDQAGAAQNAKVAQLLAVYAALLR
ncbi:MAG: hypothetical protein MUC85_04360 [Anaerolineales bacterium]|jgi:hypothetical protein|nr:hypothetical protein [Anaerolineales bacterium]